jgi:hypothetical protein
MDAVSEAWVSDPMASSVFFGKCVDKIRQGLLKTSLEIILDL